MFTTIDCICHNLTILRTLLSKLSVLSLKYLQDMNGLLIVFLQVTDKSKTETESVNETRTGGRVGFH